MLSNSTRQLFNLITTSLSSHSAGWSVADISIDRNRSVYSAVRSESHCDLPIRITGDVSHPFVPRYRAFPISCFRVRHVNSPACRRHRRRRITAYNGSCSADRLG